MSDKLATLGNGVVTITIDCLEQPDNYKYLCQSLSVQWQWDPSNIHGQWPKKYQYEDIQHRTNEGGFPW